jgi:poly-gamma-glutamate synthesis protein (capsule biosynthesis protein)
LTDVKRREFILGLAAMQPPVVRVVAGGDVLLARRIAHEAERRRDFAWPFRSIAPVLSGADLACVNLESPFSEKGPFPTAGMVFRARKEMLAGLTLAGIDVVSLANNHVRDAGEAGLNYTLKLLEEAKIRVCGLSGPALRECGGQRFAFLGYTYDQRNGNWKKDLDRISGMDVKRMEMEVRGLRDAGCVVIVMMHAGWEYRKRSNPQQQAFARAAIDAGASAVVGSHPHVVQEVEEREGGVIFYSLGNLVFDGQGREGTRTGALAEMLFSGGRLLKWRMLQTSITNGQAVLAQKYEDFR